LKFYIIGDREIVYAFKLTGIDGVIAENRAEVLEAFTRVTTGLKDEINSIAEKPKVLILTESAASMIEEEELAWQKKGTYPLIVEIPGLDGHLEGRKTLTQAIKEAIGVQI
jgi:V/A-type H+-transporting ATPase subunit F